MHQPAKHFYEFGSFRLETTERILLRDQEFVPLTPKAYETLLALVESGGRIVEKEELLKKIWPDTIVEEVSLAKKVSILRRTLGEDITHHYIETVPRRGYRFVAAVRELWQEGEPPISDQSGAAIEPVATDLENRGAKIAMPLPRNSMPLSAGSVLQSFSVGRLVWLTVLVGVGLLTGLSFWRVASRPASRASTIPLKTIPLTTFQGRENQLAFSPDGNQMAFVWNGPKDDNPEIYVSLIGAESPLRLTTNPAEDTKPVWSPDGRYLAFMRQLPDSTAFYLIPALGGAERKLVDVFPYQVPSPGNSPYYSPDGKYLAVPDKSSAADPLSIFLVSVVSGEKRRITSPPLGMGDHYPAFSPDGKMLAFVRANSLSTDDLYVLPLAGGEPKRLTFEGTPIQGVAWTSNSKEIIFSSRRNDSATHIWRIAAGGGTPERIDTVGKAVQSPAVSLHGNRLAYTQLFDDVNIWQIELDSAGRGRSQTELIASTFWDHGPDYSPDGRKIVFASSRSGGDGIWVCESDGSKPRLLIDCGPYVSGTPRWSPDGRWIAFDSRSNMPDTDGNPDIFVISADGGQPRQLTKDPAEDVVPSWSRDGRWIYFGSRRSGSLQIWKVPAEGGPATQVTQQGGFEGFEGLDGKFLYYTKDRCVPGIWRMPTAGGPEELVTDYHQAGRWRYWRVADRGIYFATGTSDGPLLEFFNFATQQTMEVFRLVRGPEKYIPGLAVSPDGRSVLYARMDHSGSDIMMVENFH